MPGNTTGASQITMEANADFSSAQYGAVYMNTSGKAVLITDPDTIVQEPLGVIYNKPTAGANALIRKFDGSGKITVNAGESITIGDWITMSTSGMAITTAAVGQWTVGRAETAASAAGERITMIASVPIRVNSLG